MIYHYVEQNSPEWYQLRSGKITASIASELRVEGKDSSGLGAGAITSAKRIALERINGKPMASTGYQNSSMSRGKDFEVIARRKFELRYFIKVQQVGFVESDCGTYGGSPDGLIGEDGLVEIKCFTNPDLHFDLILGKPSKHIDIDQIQFNLFTTERKYLKFISYYPEHESMPLVVREFWKDEQLALLYKTRMSVFNNYVNTLIEQIKQQQSILNG